MVRVPQLNQLTDFHEIWYERRVPLEGTNAVLLDLLQSIIICGWRRRPPDIESSCECNKQARTADMGGPPDWGLRVGQTIRRKSDFVTKCYHSISDLEGCCEHGNEPLSDWRLVRKDTAPWSECSYNK
jgi:hypothetical protein